MTNPLSQFQRVLVATLYFVILIFIYQGASGDISNIFNQQIDSNIWFYLGAFMIVLGSYVVEPFFTKPSDAIANSIAVIIALLGLNNRYGLIGFNFIFVYALLVLAFGVVTIALKDASYQVLKKFSKLTYWIVTKFGASKVIFSVVYLAAAYSYFAEENNLISFISILALWICLTFFDVIGMFVFQISNLLKYFSKEINSELGEAIGCDNPYLYKVEIDYLKHQPQKTPKYGDIIAIETTTNGGSLGIVVNSKYLLNKRWLSVYLLRDTSGVTLKIDLKSKKLFTEAKSIFYTKNLAYNVVFDELPEEVQNKIKDNQLYNNINQFVGYVESGSNINTINFTIQRDLDDSSQKMSEGVILKTKIYGVNCLYQVINGNTKEERLENYDIHGYTVGIARKLGKYNSQTNELETSKWMPSIYAPLFFAFGSEDINETEIAKQSIGRLPQTSFQIPIKDPSCIVTHNTALLGILGIGKSCLSFELIKKISEHSKVICIDITDEYESELPKYILTSLIDSDTSDISNALNATKIVVTDSKENGGSVGVFKTKLAEDMEKFLDSDKKIRVINPDKIAPIKQDEHGKNRNSNGTWEMYAPMSELTLAEKTRMISEAAIQSCKKRGVTKNARLMIVLEEAHSLVPEWNSVANKGDEHATNGTARVVLQGRKYGLGVMIITQRTANVTKSILNQCNTIFAMRVFDDTGKGFLENYFGEEYTNTLPTLDERHAIVIGKGLKLKQPVIIQLNDKKHIHLPPESEPQIAEGAESLPSEEIF